MFEVNTNFNTSAVETFLYSKIQGFVSKNTTARTLPFTIDNKWEDMVVIDCESPIVDYDSHGTGSVYIHLYAKPMENGIMNVAKMKELEDKMCQIIENNDDDTYELQRIGMQGDFDTNIKWHRNIMELLVKIKK